jgi:hypothetical protein
MMLVLLAALAAPKDYTDAKPNDFGLEWVEAKKDAKSGFVVGGKNDTALIKKLTEINGIKIEDLEKVMRPGKSSTAGFLGPEEKLLEVMAADNDYVLGELGLTHQEIARPLLLLGAIAAKEKGEFTYRGVRLRAERIYFKGYQDTPFEDGTKTSSDIILTNVDTGKKLRYSLLVPDMIERYGFYEGHGTRYRVDPKEVTEFLPFLKKKK